MKPHPHDQADGFSEDSADWARREAMGAYDDTWDFIFALKSFSEAQDWDEMRRDLASFKDDIPYHDFSETAFRCAAEHGQADILETMLAKKFELPAEDGAALVLHLARRHLPEAEPAVRLLVGKGFRADEAVLSVAEQGTTDVMALLQKHGCDVTGGDVFAAALQAGNAPMMKYLYEQGADIYTAPTVQQLHGGLESFQKKNPARVAGPAVEARKQHEALCDLDASRWTAFYASVSGGPSPTLDEFRTVPDGVADKGLTLMQLAARAGWIDAVVESALREKAHPLTADDLLKPSESGASVLSVVAARGEAYKVFDARLWSRRPEEAQKLHDALTGFGAGAVIDPAALTADLQRQRLKESAQSAPRLKPRRP